MNGALLLVVAFAGSPCRYVRAYTRSFQDVLLVLWCARVDGLGLDPLRQAMEATWQSYYST